MIILVKSFLNSKLNLIQTVKFVKQLFRIQIQKGGRVLLWNQVKSRMEACYSELLLEAPLWPALYNFTNNVVHNSASRGWFWCKTKTRNEKANNTPEMKIHMPIKSKQSIHHKTWNVRLENKDTTVFFSCYQWITYLYRILPFYHGNIVSFCMYSYTFVEKQERN